MMPHLDGFEVCRRIRQKQDVPIIFLSAKGETADKVTGLELGGDDYLAKPFEPAELLARVKAVARRAEAAALAEFGWQVPEARPDLAGEGSPDE